MTSGPPISFGRLQPAKEAAMPIITQTKPENRGRAHAPDDALPDRLLYTRRQAAELLGDVSLATLKRLEDEGVLRPVRLNKRSATGQVFYRHSNLMAVVQGGGDDA
jgi:hypothetical protein